MSIVRADLENDLVKKAKKIVKENGFKWSYYVEKTLEKALTETVKTGNVEKNLLRQV